MHLDLDEAIALALLAAPAFDVEGEAPRLIPPRLRFGQPGKPIANIGESTGICGRVGARSAANRRLVNLDHLVTIFKAGDLFMRPCNNPRTIEHSCCACVERIDGEAGFAAARHAGNARKRAKRDCAGYAVEIVGRGSMHRQIVAIAIAARTRNFDFLTPCQIVSRQRLLRLHDLLERALGDHFAAAHTRAGAKVDDMIGLPDRILIMLDHNHRIAKVAQPLERFQKPVIIALVEANRRLIQNIKHA